MEFNPEKFKVSLYKHERILRPEEMREQALRYNGVLRQSQVGTKDCPGIGSQAARRYPEVSRAPTRSPKGGALTVKRVARLAKGRV
jgi:hypothetical protein